jgi:glycosyltransferase involved in cell wall biosynthesis
MRVLHIITGLGVGGAENMLDRLLTELDPKQATNHVIALKEGGPIGDAIAARGIPVEIMGLDTFLPRALMPLRLAGHIRRIAPDVIQTWLYHADLIGGIAARLARPFGAPIPVIWGVRQSVVNPALLKPSTWRVIRSAAIASHFIPRRIVVNANASIAAHAELGYDTSKFMLIPNGFDCTRFRPDTAARARLRERLGIAPQTILVGIAGRFDPHKDYPGFIAAAHAIIQKNHDIAFVACGEGVDPANPMLAALLAKYGPIPQLHLLGRQTEMPAFWSALDIAVSASIGEGFSNSIGEAMSCALPCVVTDVGDSAHVVADCGCVVPPGQPDALSQAILTLAKAPVETRNALGQQARMRIQNNYSLSAAAESFLSLWQSVLQTPN